MSYIHASARAAAENHLWLLYVIAVVKGVSPVIDIVFISAPYSRRRIAKLALSLLAAWKSGVLPSTVAWLTSAPKSSSLLRITGSLQFREATLRGLPFFYSLGEGWIGVCHGFEEKLNTGSVTLGGCVGEGAGNLNIDDVGISAIREQSRYRAPVSSGGSLSQWREPHRVLYVDIIGST